MRAIIAGAAVCVVLLGGVRAASVYTERPDDPKAVYLTADRFAVKGNGVADDSAAVQAAIDKIQETTSEGILFIPQGRYRITRTIYVPPGVRLIGYGERRPVFVLPKSTPGFQSGIGCMFFFTGRTPGSALSAGHVYGVPEPPPGSVPPNKNVVDANSSTFYSAMSNIDFEIGDGNAGAVCIRFHVAQHGFLTHMDFEIGSGLAAVQDAGNEVEDVQFHSGRYGILTRGSSR